MPSPFPGMDPYLENELWTSVHAMLATTIAVQLAPQLRPRYVALPVERMVVDDVDDVAIEETSIHPDVSVLRSKGLRTERRGGVATLKEPLHLATVLPTEVPHVNVEIRDLARRRLVTAIEILSPTNKLGRGRHEYLEKRNKVMASSAHLLEIDLVRKGKRLPMRKPLPDAPYFVFLSRASRRPILDVWPIEFREPLPTVPIPLLKGDEDVYLDLQKALTGLYDSLGLADAIDYSQPPEPPLPKDQQSWAREAIRAAKKRT